MDRPLHVGWLIWGDEQGGVASALLNQAALIAAQGQRVSLWSFGPGRLADAARARGWPVHELGESAETHRRYAVYGFSLLGVLRRARVVLRLRKVLQNGLAVGEQPDVLSLPWPDLMPLAGPMARALGLGLVMEMPSAPSHYRFDINQRLYAWAVRRWRVRILANSPYTASCLARVPGVAVVTPAVDAARFDPGRVQPVSRAALGLPDSVPVLGLIARLDPAKGADLAIAALAALAAEAPELHLLLVGGPLDSPYANVLRVQARAAGVEARLRLAGPVADPERYWAACDLALNAYKGAEAFGLSIVEAMLMEKPVLAHALGQPADTIEDGRTGWLYHRPEVSALTEALRRALAMRAEWPAIGRRARAEALRRFASAEQGAHYLALLREQAELARRSPR